MLRSTTREIPWRNITESRKVVCGEIILGANFVRDIFAGITDFVGEGSGVYESKLKSGREITIKEMMAAAHSHRSDAVVGIDMDRKTIDLGQSMMMICASSTAVALEPGGE
ncbi:heavy metal-binding domain-containing protein [Verrucomicrobiales bacterium]|nr:heavy metal-binding domain-containing protein [Verrucomicrobiales bacterium]MDB3941439.1 heavy metal-binding domain-containing protein [Verrucomicrobiales bacterium]